MPRSAIFIEIGGAGGIADGITTGSSVGGPDMDGNRRWVGVVSERGATSCTRDVDGERDGLGVGGGAVGFFAGDKALGLVCTFIGFRGDMGGIWVLCLGGAVWESREGFPILWTAIGGGGVFLHSAGGEGWVPTSGGKGCEGDGRATVTVADEVPDLLEDAISVLDVLTPAFLK